jgi:hypothetical protein
MRNEVSAFHASFDQWGALQELFPLAMTCTFNRRHLVSIVLIVISLPLSLALPRQAKREKARARIRRSSVTVVHATK